MISSLFIINLFNKKPEAIPEGGNKQLEQSQINESESYNLFSNHISPKISDRNKQLLTNFNAAFLFIIYAIVPKYLHFHFL